MSKRIYKARQTDHCGKNAPKGLADYPSGPDFTQENAIYQVGVLYNGLREASRQRKGYALSVRLFCLY